MATPIGNLQDVTLRALDVFRAVDVIAAEDTRVTVRLLAHFGIPERKLMALHEHNEARSASRVIAELEKGRSIALASDAGTPAVSDPGARLVAAVRAAGFRVVPVPGPSAAVAALSASGFNEPHVLFYGFLPASASARTKALESLADLAFVLVFYEAPHRVLETVGDLGAVLGKERRCVIARELTKLFESIHAATLSEALDWLAADPHRIRGEFVLLVEGAKEDREAAAASARRTLEVLLEELPVRQAASLAARLTGARKNDLYDLALQIKATQP